MQVGSQGHRSGHVAAGAVRGPSAPAANYDKEYAKAESPQRLLNSNLLNYEMVNTLEIPLQRHIRLAKLGSPVCTGLAEWPGRCRPR